MPRNSVVPSPKSSPSCSARPMARRRHRHRGADCTPDKSMIRKVETGFPKAIMLRNGIFAQSLCRFFQVATAATLLTVALPAVADPPPAKAPVSIEIEARPIPSFDRRDRSHLRFGSLQYRSGVVLTSKFKGFGGLSGLRLDPKGEKFIAISDQGMWFTGRIVYRGDVMTGRADVEAAPMLGADGTPIAARGWYDTESIALDGSLVYIGIERVNRILRFDFSKDGTRSLGHVVATPAGVRKLPNNKGLESLVMVPKGLPLAGTLIAISERGLDSDGHIVAFLVGSPTPGTFSIRP